MSWQLVKEILEQIDLNQQNDINSEVDDEDVEVEIDEDVEVDIIYIHQRNYIILYALWTDSSLMSQLRNSRVRPLSKFSQASLLRTE